MGDRFFRIIEAKSPKDKVWIRISKKVSKKAVVRNRLRRQVREIIRPLDKDLSLYIISVLPAAKDVEFSRLKASLLEIMKRY